MITREVVLQALSDCIFEDLCDKNYYENIIKRMNTDILPRSYNRGATKLVLTPMNADFVIKIPFRGEIWGDSGYVDFENADEPDGWDYCKVETLQYKKAEEAGLEQFFAKTELIGYVNDYPIYIQQKAEIFEDLRDPDYDYEEDDLNATRDTCNKLEIGCFNVGWLTDFLDFFSEGELQTLSKHLSNNRIGDLHGGNLGYIEGQPVIVDYSDYWE